MVIICLLVCAINNCGIMGGSSAIGGVSAGTDSTSTFAGKVGKTIKWNDL